MPDLPEINAGIGGEALDKTMDADRQATAAALRRERMAAEKRAAKAESKLAQVEAAGLSASEFATHGDFIGGGGLNTNFAKQLQADLQTRDHNKRQQRMDLEGQADSVAADFANDQAVQRDREREVAERAKEVSESLGHMAIGVGIVTAVMMSASAVLGQMRDLQKTGADNEDDRRVRAGNALSGLGYGKDKQEQLTNSIRTKSGVLTPEQKLRLYEQAEAGRSSSMMPADENIRSQTEDIIAAADRGDISMQSAEAGISKPFVGRMVAGMSSRGRAPMNPGAAASQGKLAKYEADQAASESREFDSGSFYQWLDQKRKNEARESTTGAINKTLDNALFQRVNYDLNNDWNAIVGLWRRVAGNTTQPPPSTTGGR